MDSNKFMPGQAPALRLAVCTKDVMMITGNSKRGCQRMMRKLRLQFEKEKGSMITFEELGKFLKVDMRELEAYRK